MHPITPRLLLQRLDDLGTVLAGRGDALALIGLGSAGVDLHRLDEHSDLDFFVIVDGGAQQGYLDSIDWLEQLGPVAYSFANSPYGRKLLYADGVFAEYAVFTPDQLAAGPFSPGRLVWRRPGAPEGLELPRRPPPVHAVDTVDYHANEALTNLYVGLHRELRGERLTATRFIQGHAVDRVVSALNLSGHDGTRQDAFDVSRGVERRFDGQLLPLAEMVPGYGANRQAALAILAWWEQRVEVPGVLAAAIRELAAR